MDREEELKKELAEIEANKKKSKNEQDLEKAKKYENTVWMRAKKNARRSFVHITWYKDAFIGKQYSGDPKEVYFNASQLEIHYDIKFNINVSYKDKLKSKYEDNNFHYQKIHDHTEMTINHFKALTKMWKELNKDFAETAKSEIKWDVMYDREEYDKGQVAKSQTEMLDIPFIQLTSEEVWALDKSVFIYGTIFFTTPNSLKWAKERLRKSIDNDNHSTALLASAGYRNRHSKVDIYTNLLRKIEKINL